MPIAVTLELDAVAAANVEPLWDALEHDATVVATTRRIGVGPHVTLAVYDAIDPQTLLPRLGGFARLLRPVPIRFASLGVFSAGTRATVFLAPVPDRILLDLHEEFHREFADCLDRCIAHYRPASWVPHLTLAQDVESAALALAVARIAGVTVPFSGMLDMLSIVRYMPVERVGRYALGARCG
jgi:2'-5' RNA ligase